MSIESEINETIEPAYFRRVLGRFPTGVAAITTIDADGQPTGMAVGSFTSVSLDPPLVAFLPDKSSSTFPKIRTSGTFCVNVLSAEQEHICRSLAAKGADKFAGLGWRAAGSGSPILDGVVAWIDCDIETVYDAGDHDIVIGRVRELQIDHDGLPLVFFQGGYGRFAQPSLTAPAHPDLLDRLALVDTIRPHTDALAKDLDLECMVSVLVADQVVIVGSSGRAPGDGLARRVGQRIPFVPPLAMPLIAYDDQDRRQDWSSRGSNNHLDTVEIMAMLDRVRRRGWSLVLASDAHVALESVVGQAPTPEQERAVLEATTRLALDGYEPAELVPGVQYRVRTISAPVRGEGQSPVALLSIYGLPHQMTTETIETHRDRLLAAASASSRELVQS